MNKTFLFFTPFILCLYLAAGNGHTISLAEELPEFPGGEQGLWCAIEKKLNPDFIQSINSRGKLWVEFTIQPDGSIDSIRPGKSFRPDVDSVCIEVLKTLPRWKPGKLNGKAIAMKCNLPFKFPYRWHHCQD